jgi:hypothetical protein
VEERTGHRKRWYSVARRSRLGWAAPGPISRYASRMGKQRALHFAGLVAEGNAPPPAMEAVPDSHAALVTERLRAYDAGEVQAVPGAEVYGRLMARALGNLRRAAEEEPDAAPARPAARTRRR